MEHISELDWSGRLIKTITRNGMYQTQVDFVDGLAAEFIVSIRFDDGAGIEVGLHLLLSLVGRGIVVFGFIDIAVLGIDQRHVHFDTVPIEFTSRQAWKLIWMVSIRAATSFMRIAQQTSWYEIFHYAVRDCLQRFRIDFPIQNVHFAWIIVENFYASHSDSNLAHLTFRWSEKWKINLDSMKQPPASRFTAQFLTWLCFPRNRSTVHLPDSCRRRPSTPSHWLSRAVYSAPWTLIPSVQISADHQWFLAENINWRRFSNSNACGRDFKTDHEFFVIASDGIIGYSHGHKMRCRLFGTRSEHNHFDTSPSWTNIIPIGTGDFDIAPHSLLRYFDLSASFTFDASFCGCFGADDYTEKCTANRFIEMWW